MRANLQNGGEKLLFRRGNYFGLKAYKKPELVLLYPDRISDNVCAAVARSIGRRGIQGAKRKLIFLF
ncbi:MAG TPA: hypothetical protein DDW50_10545 [Firmicutes bacterium]|nr:hypothetical protein [Bacillota bacterium]